MAPSFPSTASLVEQAAQRSIVERQAAATAEVQRIVDATYEVIRRSGSFDPKMRDILEEAGLSTQAFYRHFRSKDELLVALLDDGQRRLKSYLEHQMAQADTPTDQIAAWIRGVLHQASDRRAAERTRPFLVHEQRLVEHFPGAQQATVDALVAQLGSAITALDEPPTDVPLAARAIYHMAFGMMRGHVIAGTRPTTAEVDGLIRFAILGLGARNTRVKPARR